VSFTPLPLLPDERATGTHCTGGWVGPTAGYDVTEKRNDSYVCRLKISTNTYNDVKPAGYIHFQMKQRSLLHYKLESCS
jgi:hypothetical protein